MEEEIFFEEQFWWSTSGVEPLGYHSGHAKHAVLNYSVKYFWWNVYELGVCIEKGQSDSAESAKAAVIAAYYRYLETL